jgi:small redox-active disulfide protein 2
MKKIQVLGPGCQKCKILAEHAETAAKELGIEYEIEKVSDMERIMSSGAMMMPALIVDGEIKISGRVPSAEQIKKFLQ